MAHGIDRKIILVNGRHVHVRIHGDGPPALLLHQSPRTSEELEGLMRAWGKDFTCIAPDHPGYGLSDPLPELEPDIHAFGDATAALIDALGLGAVPIYGHHTGAKIALSLAVNHPDKVTSMVMNGLLVNTPEDRKSLADNYLPPFTPSQDASHLMALWWRMREQSLFFPWYNRQRKDRMVFGIRGPEEITVAALDFLAAEDNYRRGYGAALAMRCIDFVRQLSVNTLITAVRPDPLWVDVGRIESRGPVTVERFDTMEPLLEASHAKLKEGTGGAQPSAFTQSGQRRIEGGLTTWRNRTQSAPTCLLVPDTGSEWLCEARLIDAMEQPTLAVNPPGHGLGDTDGDWPDTMDAPIDTIMSIGLGLTHLQPLLGRHPKAKLILADLLLPKDDLDAYCAHYVPDLTPDASGAHLARAFLAARSSLVFWPWQNTDHANAVPGEHLLKTQRLHERTRALLRGWSAGRDAARAADEQLSAVLSHPGGVTVALPDWAESRSDVRKDFSGAEVVYYAFDDRDRALARLTE